MIRHLLYHYHTNTYTLTDNGEVVIDLLKNHWEDVTNDSFHEAEFAKRQAS